ncbi:unnamed protein product [Peronospora belbahrii]|uniref:Uncharacterized protein n=1 Tax=Peronospora belbahrii TaxID=622444 RepID=A0AAU9L8E5_9STRA|nr:unnamed protein product [Peronospora belbahrii]
MSNDNRELNDWMSVDDVVDGGRSMDCWSGCSYGVMVSTLDFESSDPGSNPALWTLNQRSGFKPALWTLNPAIRVQFPRELNDWMSVDDFVDGAMDCWSGCSYGVMVSTLDFESSDPGSNPALWTLNPAIRVQIPVGARFLCAAQSMGFWCSNLTITLDSESSDPGSNPGRSSFLCAAQSMGFWCSNLTITLDSESSDPGSIPALWTLNPAIRVQFPRELNDWMSVDDFVDGGAMDCWSGCSYGVMVSTLDFESSDPGSNPALWTLNPAIRVQIPVGAPLWTLNPAIRVQIPVGARFSLWTLNPAIRVQSALWTLNPAIRVQIRTWTLNPAIRVQTRTLDSESSDPGSNALWTLNPAIRVQFPHSGL